MHENPIMSIYRCLLIFALSTAVLAGCSPRLTPFTQDLYDDARWSENELKRIQFYLSDPIVLRRVMSGGESTITEGKIKMIDGRRVEEIIIPENTPGILLFMHKYDRFAISFEEFSDDYLMFGPNPKIGDRYALLAREWKKQSGVVTYNGTEYEVAANSAFASLLVDLRKINKVERETRRATGRTVK